MVILRIMTDDHSFNLTLPDGLSLDQELMFVSMVLQTLQQQSHEDVKVVLTKGQFSRLKHQTISEKLSDDCPICLENTEKEDEITFLECSHHFHKNCAHKWLCETAVTCPVCRSDVRDTLKPLEKHSVIELKKMAKEKGLKGYSKLRKHELVELLA